MPSLDDVLAALFASLGPIGSLAALLVIFAVDAALFPALPEAWILITYTFRPETMDAVGWAALLLLVAVAGDLLGTTILYALVRRILVRGRRMPRWPASGRGRELGTAGGAATGAPGRARGGLGRRRSARWAPG